VTLGCSIAPRPDGSRRFNTGGGTRRRSLGCSDDAIDPIMSAETGGLDGW